MEMIMPRTIAEETKSRINNLPYRNRNNEMIIRREGIINLIKSKESGHLFATTDLIKAAGYTFNSYKDKAYQNGSNMLYTMIKAGIITRIPEVGTTKNAYAIMNDTNLGRKKRSKNKNKIVNRKIEEIVSPKKDEAKNGKESNKNLSSDYSDMGDRVYSITFTIDKKGDTDYGKKAIAKLELHDTNLAIAEQMILKTIESSK